MTLNIFLFGTPCFQRVEESLHVSRRKGVALVSYLACSKRPCSRETLATLLWPEHDHTAALKGLRRELARAKQALGWQTITASRTQLRFNHEVDVRVDVIRFRDHLRNVREHDHFPDTDCQSCVEMLTTAVDLYRDDFMEGFNLPDCPDFDQWQSRQRENLRLALGYALQQLATWHAARQTHERALLYARRWLALDPLNERARRMLMKICARAGQQATALRLYEEGEQVLQEELGIAPADETTNLWQAIRAGRVPRIVDPTIPPTQLSEPVAPTPRKRPRSSLPSQPTPFIGRDRELTMIPLRLQEPACRLLTLVGPGGIGKTRLAIEVGRRILDDGEPLFADGIFFVPLAALSRPQELVSALIEVTKTIPNGSQSPEQQLLDFIHDKQILFILDNLEHLLEVGDIISAILAAAPGVKILATSRTALKVQEEWFHPLGGLSVPPPGFARSTDGSGPTAADGPTSSRDYDAVVLFEQRAWHASPTFSLDEEVEHVVCICRLVEGMPLALELAAAWLKVLDARAVANELEQSLDLLAASFRNMADRHQSIRAVFTQSWSMLDSTDQAVMARLSVFRGGFTQEAAGRVAGATVFMLSDLVEKSLLQTASSGRYRLHELLRQFAAEQLESLTEVEESRAAHSCYYLKVLEQRESELKGVHQRTALKQIKADLENIRLAWDWALGKDDVSAVEGALESLFLYFFVRGRNQEGIDFLQPARRCLAPHAGEDPSFAWGRLVSRLSLMKSHLLPAAADIEEGIQISLAIAQQHQNQSEIAFCYFCQGIFNTLVVDDADAAQRAFEQARWIFQSLDESFYLVQVLIWMGFCHGNTSRLDLYFEFTREALALARAAGHKAGAAHALSNLVGGAFCVGDYATAERYANEVGAIGVELDLPSIITHSKTQLCLACFLRGDIELAGKLATEAHQMALDIHYPLSIAYTLTFLGLHASITGDYVSGKRFGEESLATPSPRFGVVMGHWAVAIASCGLYQDHEAWRHALTMLELARRARFTGITTWPLPVMALVSARAGQTRRAVELLALAQTHPLSPTGWQTQWPLLAELHSRLEAELGAAAFATAWERGEALELDTTIAELLDNHEDVRK